MWFSAIVLYILTQCWPLDCQRHDKSGSKAARDIEEDNDILYNQLSPEAFFAMKDNQPPVAPLEQHPLEAYLNKPGVKPGTGSMEPGASHMGSGMGSMGPRAPHMGSGMGPMGPGAPHMGPGMGPMGPGAPHMGPGMGPMGPGASHKGPGMGPRVPHMGPGLGSGASHMGPGIGPRGPGAPPMGPAMGPTLPGMGPMKPMTANMGDLAPNGMRGYEHFDLSILDTMSRQQTYKPMENYAEEVSLGVWRWTEELIIYNLCFCISYIWRRGRESIRKYFRLRDLYHNHLPFEVGYITHVIMSKYQTMLELYEYAATLAKKEKNTITRFHMTQFQKTMVEDGLTIQHMANMLHELKNKYAFQKYSPTNRFDIPPKGWAGRTGEPEPEQPRAGKEKGYLDKKIEESHKAINETVAKRKKKMQEAKEFYKKHGYYPTTTTAPQQPMRLWSPNLDYRFSGEEDW